MEDYNNFGVKDNFSSFASNSATCTLSKNLQKNRVELPSQSANHFYSKKFNNMIQQIDSVKRQERPDEIEISQETHLHDLITKEAISEVFNQFKVNTLLTVFKGLSSKFLEAVNEHLIKMSSAELRLEKVEKINKKNKSIDDLLLWNSRLTDLIAGASANVRHLSLICEDFKIFNPLNERLVSSETFINLQSYTCGMLDDEKFPRFISTQSIFNHVNLITLNLQFSKLSAVVSEALVKHFRDPQTFQYRKDLPLKNFTIEYMEREREAILTILQGVLHENNNLEEFHARTKSSETFQNVNNFVENFEDFRVGAKLKKLTMLDSFKYTDETRFLQDGTGNVEELLINKTILFQKNFKLSDKLRVLKLTPVNFHSEFFEIKFDQFLFVLENLADNRNLTHFEIGLRHGGLKKKIFNDRLYEKERMISTQRLSNSINKILQYNKTLTYIDIQYKHANFDVSLQIAANIINSVRNRINNIRVFNRFPIKEYLESPRLNDISLFEHLEGFDAPYVDPIFNALVVALILSQDKRFQNLRFAYQNDAFEYYYNKAVHLNSTEQGQESKYFKPDIDTFAQAFQYDHTSVCEPIENTSINILRGMLKTERPDDNLQRFDLGYIPRKYHMIFLYFLRLNPHVHALHARNICLKADVVRQLLQDFKNLREFTLQFYNKTDKRKEASTLVQSILKNWFQVEYIQLENFQFNISSFTDNNLYDRLNQSEIRHINLNNVYLYNTKIYQMINKNKKSNFATYYGRMMTENFEDSLPINEKVESIIVRDLKLAYGMPLEVEFIEKFSTLRIFIIELNDLRGSDRASFPKTIALLTQHLAKLTNLQCVELTQRPGNTSCTFEDSDIEPDCSIDFLKSIETLLNNNQKLRRINIFYPILLQHMEMLANICLPKIFGQGGTSHLLNFYGLNCQQIREDKITSEFLTSIYHCFNRKNYLAEKEIISTRNYKYKQGIPSMIPIVALRLFQYVTLPKVLHFYKKEVNVEEELQFATEINFVNYKNLLNSDFTMLLGISMLKNHNLQKIELVNLNIYDIDIQVLVHNISNLIDLQKLSFKRSTFMDKVTNIEKLIIQGHSLKEINFNMTNILSQLATAASNSFFEAIERNLSIKKLKMAAICQDMEDSKKLKLLLRAIRNNTRLKYLNISENFLTGACFHMLKDIFFRGNRNIRTLKFYLGSSDRLFNEMFLELQRFYEEVVRRGPSINLKTLILSKGNEINFKQEITQKKSVLYIGENRQLADIVFLLEKSKRHIDQIRQVVFRGRLGETKEFSFYINEFLKDCSSLTSLFIINTNLGGLLRNCKNVNPFRALATTKLKHVNLTSSDLKNALVERVVCALRQVPSMQKLIVKDNFEIEPQTLGNLFRLKKMRVQMDEEDYSITFL